MVRRYEPTKSEVLQAATAAIATLGRLGYKSCLVGGVACALYGNSRVPGDVDLVVLTSGTSQESLKTLLVNADPSFYTVAAKTPGATYRVLWYRFSLYRSCKVDILLPGVMTIPAVPEHHIELVDGLPVMPLAGVLLLKLQAWQDHRDAIQAYMYLKQHVDAADIRQMLRVALARRVRPAREDWLPESFLTAARKRVRLFVASYADTALEWRNSGML